MQDIKARIKVVAAALAGGLMLGATMAGAVAADLGQLPAPFVEDHNLKGAIVIGANAAVDDVIAAAQVAAALGEFLVSAKGGEASTQVTGGKAEDVAIGNALSATTDGFGKTTFTDADIPSLKDTSISFRGDDYDVHEEVIIGNTEPKLVTGIDTSDMAGVQDGDSYGSDVGAKVYLKLTEDSVKYHYVFDDALNASKIDSSHPLEIEILGKKVKIINVPSANKITVEVGEKATLKQGESITVEGATIEVIKIGEDAVDVKVTKGSCTDEDFVDKGDTWDTNCDVKVKVDSILYDSNDPSSSMVKIIAGEDIDKTYQTGDEFIGEDEDDPVWVWDINMNGAANEYIGVKLKKEVTSIDDNPVTVGGEFYLPNNYVKIKLVKYTVDKYGTFEFKFDNSEDIYANTSASNPDYDNVPVLYVVGPTDDAFSDGTHDSEKLAFYYDSSNDKAVVAYWDKDKNKWIIGYEEDFKDGYDNSTGWTLKYEDTSYTIKVFDNVASGVDFAIKLVAPSPGSDITINPNDNMQYLGASDNEAEAGEVFFGSQDISTAKTDIMDHYGTIIVNPDSNGDSDKVIIKVPSEQLKVNVYIGSGNVATTAASAEVVRSVIGSEVAVLDNEGYENRGVPLILVGGPAVNALAREILGPRETHFEEWKTFFGVGDDGKGKGVIKLYDASETPWNVPVLLVAGWEAKDTRAAAYVLAKYLTEGKVSEWAGKSKVMVSGETVTTATVVSTE